MESRTLVNYLAEEVCPFLNLNCSSHELMAAPLLRVRVKIVLVLEKCAFCL